MNQSGDQSLKAQLAAGDAPVGSWVSLTSPAAAELVAGLGFDFVVVDTEHAPLSTETVADLARAVEAAGHTSLVVRVADNDPVAIKLVLDVGADGVMAPQINTIADAESLVEAVRYPPGGIRGVAGSRASDYGRRLGEYYGTASDEITVLPQIETEQAVGNAREIAAVDGVDALFLGPADLSADLDCFGDYDDPAHVEAVDRLVEAGADVEVPVGTIATADEEIEMWHDRGIEFLVVGTDVGYLTSGAQAAKERYESTFEGDSSVERGTTR